MLFFWKQRSKSVTLLIFDEVANLEMGTTTGGQFGWGGTLQKRYL